jgi:hypothetical protein
MSTLTQFYDKLFIIAFRAAFWFFRRPTAKAKAVEPAPGTMNWLAAPASGLSWEAALSGAAQRQQAKQHLN